MQFSIMALSAFALIATASPVSYKAYNNETVPTLAKRYYQNTICELTNPETGQQIGGYDEVKLYDLRNDLGNGGGDCTAPAGPGKCIRVSCYDTTGIWMCNDNDYEFTTACGTIATYVGSDNGLGIIGYDSIASKCDSSGQAFDSLNFNVIAAYANCDHDPTVGPFHQ